MASPLEDRHAEGAAKIGVGRIVVQIAGGGRTGRFGYIYDLEGAGVAGGDRRVRLIVPLKDCHANGAAKLGAGRRVGDVAGGGRIVRVGDIYDLEGAIIMGGDSRVCFTAPLKDCHADGGIKLGAGCLVVDVAGGGRAGRVCNVDDLDGIVLVDGDGHVGLAVLPEHSHPRRARQ